MRFSPKQLAWVPALAIAGFLNVPATVVPAVPREPVAEAPYGVRLSRGEVPDDPAARAYRERRLAGARATLDARSKALRERDVGAFRATLDRANPAFVARQERLFRGVAKLDLAAWAYEVDAAREWQPYTMDWERYGGADVYLPYVVLAYRLRDLDPAPVRRESVLTFVERDGRWLLGGDADVEPDDTRGRLIGATAAHDPWDVGEIAVARGTRSLLIGHPRDSGRLPALARAVDEAVAAVTAVWGTGWPGRAVVALPRDEALLRVVFDHGEEFGDIAAVAVPTGGGGGRIIVNPDEIDVDPDVFGYLMRHEVAHLAEFAAGPNAPRWLMEGIAEYVAYRPLRGAAVAGLAPETVAKVRAGQVPEYLPLDPDFAGDPEASYETAWLACYYIADTYGVGPLLALFRRMAALPDRLNAAQELPAALRATLGVDERTFLAGWRQALRRYLA